MSETKSINVRKNDSPWKVAQRSLAAQNKKADNNAIIKEMERLAKINGCEDVDDFSSKFFKKIDTAIKLTEDNTPQKETKKAPRIKQPTIDSTYVAKTESTGVAKNDSLKFTPYPTIEEEIRTINNMPNDLSRIIQYNKKHASGNYIIVDKKTCMATVYDKTGKRLKSYEVLLGATKGDDLSTAFAKNPELAKNGRRTVPGEYKFTLADNQFGGSLLMGDINSTVDPDVEPREWQPGYWGKRKFSNKVKQAMHGTANRKERDKYYNNGNLEDNRQSMGCVNIPVENLKEMKEKYGIDVGSTIYILPEDKGNSLKLQKQKDGTIKFVTHYANLEQHKKLVKVNKKIAEKNITKLQAQTTTPKKESFCWYKPTTWFS